MRKTIYFIRESNSGAIKIGFTCSLGSRKSQLNSSNPSDLVVLAAVQGTIGDEMKLHHKFGHLRIKGEWYKPEQELLEFIENTRSTGNIPADLNKAVIKLEGCGKTESGQECQKWIEIANNLPPTQERDELISIGNAAKILGVAQQTLRSWESQGRIKPHFTAKGHRRYTRKQLTDFRKQQMNQKEIVLPGITPAYLIDMVTTFVKSFDPLETISLTLLHDTAANRVRITLDSADGLTAVSKTFNTKD